MAARGWARDKRICGSVNWRNIVIIQWTLHLVLWTLHFAKSAVTGKPGRILPRVVTLGLSIAAALETKEDIPE